MINLPNYSWTPLLSKFPATYKHCIFNVRWAHTLPNSTLVMIPPTYKFCINFFTSLVQTPCRALTHGPSHIKTLHNFNLPWADTLLNWTLSHGHRHIKTLKLPWEESSLKWTIK